MIMSWIPVYIRGKTGYQTEVLTKLKERWMAGNPADIDLLMFWLPVAVLLRSLKIAIGSSLILKYRLHFLTDLNENLAFDKKQSGELSAMENEMVNRMVEWDSARRHSVLRRGSHAQHRL
jgi:hypothetical protein